MNLAAGIPVRSSRRLAAALLTMVLASQCALGAWLMVLWRNHSEIDSELRLVAASGLVVMIWTVSCVLTWRWWRGCRTWRLVIEGTGETFRVDRVEQPGVFGAARSRPACESHAQMSVRMRPVPGSLVWPGIIALHYVADAALQHEPWHTFFTRGAIMFLPDSVSPADYRAIALWMHWLQRKGAAPIARPIRAA